MLVFGGFLGKDKPTIAEDSDEGSFEPMVQMRWQMWKRLTSDSEDTLLGTITYPLPFLALFEWMIFSNFPRRDMWSFPGGYLFKTPDS